MNNLLSRISISKIALPYLVACLAACFVMSTTLSSCKKKQEAEKTTEKAQPAPAVKAVAKKQSAPSIPKIALNGSPSQNLITVFSLGLNAVNKAKGNGDKAAAAITQILKSYNVADIRTAAKAAKEAGNGATDTQKSQLMSMFASYKKGAEVLGSNSPAFLEAHKQWSQAFGIK